MAWRDLYVVEDLPEFGTEGEPEFWSWADPESQVQFHADSEFKLVGKSSVRANVEPYSGGRVTLRFAPALKKTTSLADKSQLVFWLKTRNENLPAWQDLNPLVAIKSSNGTHVDFTPDRDLLSSPPYIEAREGWTYFQVPLAGSAEWKRSEGVLTDLAGVSLGFDSWGAPPLVIWVDGLSVK
jgi:hypothetical protein